MAAILSRPQCVHDNNRVDAVSILDKTSYHKISWSIETPRLLVHIIPYCFGTWQVSLHQCCRNTCRVSKRSDNSKYKSSGFKILQQYVILDIKTVFSVCFMAAYNVDMDLLEYYRLMTWGVSVWHLLIQWCVPDVDRLLHSLDLLDSAFEFGYETWHAIWWCLIPGGIYCVLASLTNAV